MIREDVTIDTSLKEIAYHLNELTFSKLNEDDVGLWVVYVGKRISAHPGHHPLPARHEEWGRIKSWNDKFVFVVYKCAGNWDDFENYTAQATEAKDLVIPSAAQLKERLQYWESQATLKEWQRGN